MFLVSGSTFQVEETRNKKLETRNQKPPRASGAVPLSPRSRISEGVFVYDGRMIFGTPRPEPLALSAVSNGALRAALSAEQIAAGEKLPKRIKVLSWGNNETVKGAVLLDLLPESFAAAQFAMGRQRVALDFEHNTLPGHPAYEAAQEPRAVAAYGTPEIVPNEGLYLSELTWTPAGIAAALNYEDISPAPILDKDRRVVALHSVALTRAGAVHELHFFSATQTQSEIPKMTEEQMAKLAALETAVADLTAAVAEMKALMGKDVEPLSASVNALAGTVETMQRDALVNEATRDGKVIPLSADDIAKTPLQTLRNMVAQLKPGVVPLSAATRAPAVDAQPSALDATLLSVAKVTGFSVEQLRSGTLNPSKKD
jgi:phage I-like protein